MELGGEGLWGDTNKMGRIILVVEGSWARADQECEGRNGGNTGLKRSTDLSRGSWCGKGVWTSPSHHDHQRL